MMARILFVETASPKRITFAVKRILGAATDSKPEINILCLKRHRSLYPDQPGLIVHALDEGNPSRQVEELNRKSFDIVYSFWTGEKQYRQMKLFALRLRAAERRVIAGDGNEFRLTWKAVCRHAWFRYGHPLPTDHWDFELSHPASVPPKMEPRPVFEEERILVLQTAEPPYILQALDRLAENPLFRNPRYTLFCRNRLETLERFKNHPSLYAVRTHSETRGSWKHLRELRKSRFDAQILFLTGDPSYWKLKAFSFLLGVPLRRTLIFNESVDCFFFNWNQWLELILHRMRSQPISGAHSKWANSLHLLVSLLIKSGMLPFRFFWLLLVWLRLRAAGLIFSRR